MSLFKYNQKTFSQGYVFYPSLIWYHKNLAFYAHQGITKTVTSLKYNRNEVRALRDLANKEKTKELALLNNVYKKSLSIDLTDPAQVRQLVEAINETLSISDVFNRSKELIQRMQGKKDIYTFFPDYFKKAFEERFENLINQLLNLTKDSSWEAKATPIIEKCLEESTQAALEHMITTNEAEHKNSNYQAAYQEILSEIGSFTKTNSLTWHMRSIYQLDKIEQLIKEELLSNNSVNKKLKTKVNKQVGSRLHIKGGFALEAWFDEIFRKTAKQKGGDSIRLDTTGLRAKADNLLTIGFDLQPVMSLIEEQMGDAKGTVREKNVQIFSEVQKELEKTKEGFVVYVSTNNYALNQRFRDGGGYPAGAPISADTYQNIMRRTMPTVDTLIGLMMQVGEGAMGSSGELKEQLEREVAKQVAYMLFDDFETIGNDLTTNVNALHIMNLNGVLLPISVILSMLADAISKATQQEENLYREVVSVEITAPPVLFKKSQSGGDLTWADVYQRQGGYSVSEAWEAQRSHALQETKIATHFLSNFANFMRTFS